MDNLFEKLKDLAEENGIDLGTLRRVIDESDGYGDVVSKLAMESVPATPASGVNKMNSAGKRAKTTDDSLNSVGQPIKTEKTDKYSDDKVSEVTQRISQRDKLRTTRNRTANNNPEDLFPEGSDLINAHRKGMRDRGKQIQNVALAEAKHPDDEVLFPDTDEDYSMIELVRESIKSYKEHKNRYNSKADKIPPFSQIQAQLY